MEGDTRVTGKKTRIFRVNDLGRNEVERMMESWGWGWVKKNTRKILFGNPCH